MKIYGMSGSPFVRRTELVLTEKGVDYKLITLSRVDGELQSPEHLARNPRGRVPVLEDGDLLLYESQAIVEYLEDRYPEPTLVPADLGDRGHMRVAEMECLIYFGGVLTKVAQNVFRVAPEKRGARLWQHARPTIRPIPRIGGSINLIIWRPCLQ